MSDTSLVFNLVARDRASATVQRMGDKITAASATIGAGIGVALGVGVAANLDMEAANAKLTAQLGVGPAEAADLAKVSASVYGNAWGESTAEVNEAIKGVYQQIGDTSQAEGGLEGVTTKVMALSQTFDQDLGGTTAAVGQMIKTGLADNADEALDILARGFQTGTDKAGDLLDTMTEYGTQFRKFGLDGETATGLLSQGLKAGARDADTVADAIKEFSIRAVDGSKSSASGFAALGLNAKKMTAQIGQGGEKATAGLDVVLDKLRAMDDPVAQQAAAVALFGTKAEDLGQSLYSLDPSSAVAALGKVGGAAGKMAKTMSDTPAAALERFKRQAIQKLAAVTGTFVDFAMSNQQLMEPLAYTLGGIAATVLVVRGAMMAWAAAQAVWTAATTVATGAQWLWNSALFASPITWIIVGIVALIAVIVLIATKTTWFQTLWTTIWGGITAATSWAVAKVGSVLNWFGGLPGRFAAWFGGAKDAAIIKAAQLVVWVTGLPGRIVRSLASLAGRLWTSASGAFQRFKDAAIIKAATFIVWVTGLPGRIARGIGNLGSLLLEKGRNVVQGLWNGISAMGGWIRSKLIGWAKAMIPGPIAKALGIASPSKVTTAQGRWIARGLVNGLTGSAKQVRSAATKLADIVRDGLKPGKNRSKALAKISAGSKALQSLANKEVQVAAKIKTATKALGDQIKARDKLAADVKKGVLDGANITSGAADGPVSASSILATLSTKMQQAKQFAATLATLRKKGVRSDLIAQIAQAGVEQGTASATALATASKSQISQINATQGQLVTAATQAGNTAGTAMYGAGIQAANGLVKGLKSQQKQIEKQMTSIATAMAKAIKKALGIHSPSRVFADEVGSMVPAGIMQGMADGQAQLDRAMAAVVHPPSAAGTQAVARQMSPVQAAPLMTGSNSTTVRIEVAGPEEMKRLLRGIVRKDGRGSVQLAFGTGKG
ncbi:phage tail tape measure protein [Streptomyces brevispora]|uniref:phage tail tape measure protein n=1 Tax=Streptomyces brevispora TaxID=887462 RepID=UPI002E334675|nr:phage tail tape measure protein [Streptomyces brevispora]